MNRKLLELLSLYEQYINFIGKSNEEPIQVAFTHGWKCSKAVYDEGVAFRDKIQALQLEVVEELKEVPSQGKPEIMTQEFWRQMHKNNHKKEQ